MKRFQIPIFFFFLSLLANTVNGQPDKIKLQLKWWHQFQFAGYYAASIKGFYKAEGLDVLIKPGKELLSPVAEVLNGNADYAVTGSELLLNFSEGAPVKVLGAIFQHSPYVIISQFEKHIIAAADLKGKTIMCAQNQGIIELKALALKNSIPLDSINFKEHSWNNIDITNGKADAMTGYSSVEVFQLREQQVSVNVVKPSNYGIDFYGDVVFCSEKTLDKNRAVTDRFMKATFAGWEYAMQNPNELADYILTLPGVKERGVTKNALLFEAGEMKQLLLPGVVEMGHMTAGRWQNILDNYKSLDMVSKDQTLEGFIYNQQKASEENLLELMGIIFIIIGMLFAYSISLKRAVRKRTKELEVEIIQRKKQEAGLEKISYELQVTNNELEQFAYLTSHNLRAPVTNLRSLIKLFDKENLHEKNKLFFDKIEFSVNNFNEMLSDLNVILSARKEEVASYKTLNFGEELQHVMNSISQTAADDDLNVLHDFSKSPQVYCQQDVLRSVLLNLVTNAIKYKKMGNKPELFLQSDLSGDYIILKATDKGIGINLNKYGNRLFNPYQRLHPHIEGKGLGLYLIKIQVEKMGGKINVESVEKKGTTFTVYFKRNL